MTKRLSKTHQQHILQEMIKLARFLTIEGIPAPKVKDAVGHLRDDLKQAYRQGIEVKDVDRNTYLEQFKNETSTEESI